MATTRQKKAIANLVENGGIISRAMLDAGYSPATAKTPQKLTESIGFRTLADRIPDDLLEKVHLEGLQATQVRFTPEGNRIDVEDYATRHKYLDTAHKLKGTYAPEKSVTLTINTEPNERLKKLAERLNQ